MSQLVKELGRCEQFRDRVSIVPLTSRKGLCVHEQVGKIDSVQMMTEKCEDLTEKGKCPYNDPDLTSIITQNILTRPLDIEDLSEMSQRMQICGYYGARSAQSEADILVTPYQTILSETTRNSVGISLYNKIVVFDEAHNIMETVASMFTVTQTFASFYQSHSQIMAYLKKYELRMGAKNAKCLRELAQICADFVKFLKS